MKKKRRLRTMILVFLALVCCLASAAYLIPRQARFGALPQGERLARIQASQHYKNGGFLNTVPTERHIKGESTATILWDNLWADKSRLRPPLPLPTVKTDLKTLDKTKDLVVWLGHSSYFVQLGGKRILVDPVFSDHAAPFSFMNKAFSGTDIYTAADMPEIDFLLISHDHWDHLDYQTILESMPKVANVIVPLGVGAHFDLWGYPKEKIIEADWNTALPFDNNFTVHVVPARHYSMRKFTQNQTLWAGFVLETPQRRLFFSGDSGYGPHFAGIAGRFQSFDLVMLDNGQYDPRWPLLHMTPEEAVAAATVLGAQAMLPGHVGRFAIASHPWDEPFQRVVAASRNSTFCLLTPKIGEPVLLNDMERHTTRWWEDIQQ